MAFSNLAANSLLAAALLLSGCTSMSNGGQQLTLVGASEVPAVTTTATGASTIAIATDGSVTGSVTVTGMTPTASHIHMGGPGLNGPVIVPFVRSGDTFAPMPGAKLTDEQMTAYRAGNLYVNVHSAAHPGGEIRAQLKAN